MEKVFEFRSKDVVFDEQTCKMVILRDVSEVIKREYAKSIEKLSDIMVASTSHDMKTPLNSIINMLGTI